MRPLRGFDRLQAAGFTPEDIASIRRQFHTESTNGLGDVDLNNDERAFRKPAPFFLIPF